MGWLEEMEIVPYISCVCMPHSQLEHTHQGQIDIDGKCSIGVRFFFVILGGGCSTSISAASVKMRLHCDTVLVVAVVG